MSELEIDRGNTPTRQAVIDYSIIDLEIDQIVRRLAAMHSAIVRLNLIAWLAIYKTQSLSIEKTRNRHF
jgi:hypothetical protein